MRAGLEIPKVEDSELQRCDREGGFCRLLNDERFCDGRNITREKSVEKTSSLKIHARRFGATSIKATQVIEVGLAS